MKKLSLFLSLLFICTMLFSLVAGADFTNLQDGKQVKIGSVKTDVAPVIDGVVSDGEYTVHYTFTENSKGIDNSGSTIGYVDVNLAHDSEYLYMAFVVQEDEYSYKPSKNGNAYSKLFLSIGFKTKDSMDAANSLCQNTMSISDDDKDKFFTGCGLYFYPEGSCGAQAPTNWNYLRKIVYSNVNNHAEDHKMFVRTTDKDGKAITIYEFKYTVSQLCEAFGIKKIEGPFLMRFSVHQCSSDGKSLGHMGFYDKMTDDEKLSKTTSYGWCPSNLPHVMQLYDTKAEMDADIAEFDKNNQPPVTTTPPVTTAPPVTTETPDTSEAIETTPKDNCIGLTEPIVTTEPPYIECPTPPDTTIYKVDFTMPVGSGDFETAIIFTYIDNNDDGDAIKIECAESSAIGAAILAMIAIGSAAIVVKKKH